MKPWHVQEHDFPHDGTPNAKLQFLLHYAILAPSSHNTQPWKFAVGVDQITIFADKSRWLRIADQDQRELYVSLGCALENMLVAAEHFGYAYRVTYCPEPANGELAATVSFMPSGQSLPAGNASLFEAIPRRHTNHKVYAERPIPDGDLQQLQNCCVEEGIQLHLTTDMAIKRQIDDLVVRADILQFADPDWREELGYWIGQGAFGTPWLIAKLGQLAVTYLNMGQGSAKKDSEVLLSAPVLAAISSQTDDRTAQIKVGQVFERVALMATALGIRVHPMNQILQVPEIKAEVARIIPTPGAVPQLTFRMGYAEADQDHSPRRPLEEVLVEERRATTIMDGV